MSPQRPRRLSLAARARAAGGIVVALATTKGGAGKSVTALNFAIEAAQRGLRVLLIDTDIQRTTLDAFDVRTAPTTVQSMAYPHEQIWQDLERLRAGYDLVVIDGPGRHDHITRAVIVGTGRMPHGVVVVPVKAGTPDVWATVRDVWPILTETAALVPWVLKARTVLTQVNPRKVITQAARESLAQHPVVPPTRTEIGDRTIFTQALTTGMAACEVEPGGPAAAEIAALVTEICELALSEPEPKTEETSK